MNDLVLIKKYYGEDMMHFCRAAFPTILEEEGKLFELLDSHFNRSKLLFKDIVSEKIEDELKKYIYNLIKPKEELITTELTPFELMDKAGYVLYECKNEHEIQAFKKYYKKNEALCTFKGHRLDTCYVFFAVKKDVSKIRRQDFKKPKREDEYGTSVISIQFARGDYNHLSIKNRYNHTVKNPDATFGNNLENIIPGLTDSFIKNYNLKVAISSPNSFYFEPTGYVMASDGKYYKYNMEIDDVYYCPDNIIISHGQVIRDFQDKSRYLIVDSYIIDFVNKEVKNYNNGDDSFPLQFTNIQKIIVTKIDNNEKKILFYLKDNIIEINISNRNTITYYKNDKITSFKYHFLNKNTDIRKIDTPNVKRIEDYVLEYNLYLQELSLPKVKFIGNNFLFHNVLMDKLNLENVVQINHYFMNDNLNLSEIDMPNLEVVGHCFLRNNKIINKVNLPKLKHICDYFLDNNNTLKTIDLPNVKIIDDCFMSGNEVLESLNMPKVVEIGGSFLSYNQNINKVNLPEVLSIGGFFMANNTIIDSVYMPKVIKIKESFLRRNENLTEIYLPFVRKIGYEFLKNNKKMNTIYLPNVKYIDDFFLQCNEELESLDLPNLIELGAFVLESNNKFTTINMPLVEKIGNFCFCSNNSLKELSLPMVKEIGFRFLWRNKLLENVYMPNLTDIKKQIFFNNPKLKFKIISYVYKKKVLSLIPNKIHK